jgi:hypothetical protein
MTQPDIDPVRALDFMRDKAVDYAKAKSERIFLEEFRKSKKAMLMKQAETLGFTSAAAQEREAYAHADYLLLLEGLREAVIEEEKLRWQLVAAQTKVEVWRSMNATNRAIDKGHQ